MNKKILIIVAIYLTIFENCHSAEEQIMHCDIKLTGSSSLMIPNLYLQISEINNLDKKEISILDSIEREEKGEFKSSFKISPNTYHKIFRKLTDRNYFCEDSLIPSFFDKNTGKYKTNFFKKDLLKILGSDPDILKCYERDEADKEEIERLKKYCLKFHGECLLNYAKSNQSPIKEEILSCINKKYTLDLIIYVGASRKKQPKIIHINASID